MDRRSKFHVMSCGRVLPGYDMDDVGEQVAALCTVSLDKARVIVSKQKVLKKNLDLARAKQYQHSLERIGIEIRLLEMHPSTTELHARSDTVDEQTENLAKAGNRPQTLPSSHATKANPRHSRGKLFKTLNKLPDIQMFHDPVQDSNTPTRTREPRAAPQTSHSAIAQAVRSLTPWHGFAMQLIKARQTKLGALMYDKIAQDYKTEELAAIGQLVLFVTGIVNTVICGSRELVPIRLRDLLETGQSCSQHAESQSKTGSSNR